MIGYKAFNKDLTCLSHAFEIGKIYGIDTELKICKNGYHFCKNLLDVYNYYDESIDTRICVIEAIGKIITEKDKSVTDKIKIVRELSEREILEAVLKKNNSGNNNSGHGNSGHRNNGNSNSGNGNSGHRNSGNSNSGNGNNGHRNSGNSNSGNGNNGHDNSGHRNSGNSNSGNGNNGHDNSGHRNNGNSNSGCFNTLSPLYFFNKPTDIKWTPELENKIRSLNVKPIVTYILLENMTDEEKLNNPSASVTGGFLRKTNRMFWNSLTDLDKIFIKSLPNYNDDIFEKISGLRLLDPKTITNNKEFEIDIEKLKN